MWDSDDNKDKDILRRDGREEVKRVKKAIGSVDVKSIVPKDVSLSLEKGKIENHDLNFSRQIKKNVNNYKYKTVYNVGKTKHPYLLTRNSVVIMLEEYLGAEVIVQGTYKPEELNGDTDDEDALLLEISAPSPNELQDAMFRLASVIKSMSAARSHGLELIRKCIYKNGVQYRTSRIPLDAKCLESKEFMSEIHESVASISSENPVELRVRGRSSGYIEPCFNEESDEPTYIQIISKTKPNLELAERSCQSIILRHSKNAQG